jgi:hypothetical protein
MSARPCSLSFAHRTVLRATRLVVPPAERDDFLRSWHAELYHMRHCVPRRRLSVLRLHVDLPLGVASDALWLRTHSLRRSLAGTPALCIASLLALSILTFAFALLSYGGWHALALHLTRQAEQCLIAVPIIFFVSYSIASFSRVEINSIPHTLRWINHLIFATLKTSLALLLMFLLSVCVARPIYIPLPHAADFVQILFFVVFALLAVRWCFLDQEQRCKHCLCLLATPARVGRPSHNLLEWNGTEQTCKHGHGHLSVPEIITSWHQYSRWVDQTSGFDQIAST